MEKNREEKVLQQGSLLQKIKKEKILQQRSCCRKLEKKIFFVIWLLLQKVREERFCNKSIVEEIREEERTTREAADLLKDPPVDA